jgi:hypothetical protein
MRRAPSSRTTPQLLIPVEQECKGIIERRPKPRIGPTRLLELEKRPRLEEAAT